MKIIKQDGNVVMSHSIEMQGCTIFCTPDDKPDRRVECGKYQDMLRTTEVFSEMTFAGWNLKKSRICYAAKLEFDECMRVLEPDGLLVFKWNEDQIPLPKVLKAFDRKPLLGDQRGKTRWLVFIK